MKPKKVLIVGKEKAFKKGSIHSVLLNKEKYQLHYLNNENLLQDPLFLKGFSLAIINKVKSIYIDSLLENKVPSIVLIGKREQHLISVVSNAQGIVSKEKPEEIHFAIEMIEKGGFYFSTALKQYIFPLMGNKIPFDLDEELKYIPTILTEMELKVVEELINDKTNQQIADTLYLSKRTVEYYITSSMQKLKVNSRVGLAVKMTKAILLQNQSISIRKVQTVYA
ncbi:LuxR C-terminal-related transcriptional regulator [Cytobacillus kochii]|uniref:response regulator transcription factor n=1 Tax=Cytobacillus kochii TaxID=859143 RepID=UPI002E230CDB|nr:LuxR C-terminal-related transcriptional regulator [Cytobacillus kochii]MED1605736.1 LuxR C-terminal-related transcriptional regulator [Cytobacillus kochii]